MKLQVYSKSASFERFLAAQVELDFEFSSQLQAPGNDSNQFYLLHLTGMEIESFAWLAQHAAQKARLIATCSDMPGIHKMLECGRLGARAYCNSRMSTLHYQQMLSTSQSWFPPQMLDETFKLAQRAVKPACETPSFNRLTAREKQVALAVADGHANRRMAEMCQISKPTVKTHLSNIFKKLGLNDRVAWCFI